MCRFCNREVEPVGITSPEVTIQEQLGAVRSEFPAQFDDALVWLHRLEPQPQRPAEWLRELCNRSFHGAPLELAASRIPLDWAGKVAIEVPEPALPQVVVVGNPDATGDFDTVKASHPQSYNTARSLLAGLQTSPDNAAAWLEELCTRIDAGSPPKAAAARIPLSWQPRVRPR